MRFVSALACCRPDAASSGVWDLRSPANTPATRRRAAGETPSSDCPQTRCTYTTGTSAMKPIKDDEVQVACERYVEARKAGQELRIEHLNIGVVGWLPWECGSFTTTHQLPSKPQVRINTQKWYVCICECMNVRKRACMPAWSNVFLYVCMRIFMSIVIPSQATLVGGSKLEAAHGSSRSSPLIWEVS